jgi:hypothetical protein
MILRGKYVTGWELSDNSEYVLGAGAPHWRMVMVNLLHGGHSDYIDYIDVSIFVQS